MHYSYLPFLFAVFAPAIAFPGRLSTRGSTLAVRLLPEKDPVKNVARSNTSTNAAQDSTNSETPEVAPERCEPPGYDHWTNTCGPFNGPTAEWQVYTPDQLQDSSKVLPSVNTYYCLEDSTGESINSLSCNSNIQNLCKILSAPGSDGPPRGQWVWSSGGANCTFGAWLPIDGGSSAPNPSLDHCMRDILGPMATNCGKNSRANAASANLKVLPVENGPTGEAFDGNYPSYIMVSESYDVTCGGPGQSLCI